MFMKIDERGVVVRGFFLLAAALLALCVFSTLINPARGRPIDQRALSTTRVYAYRRWQSIGVKLYSDEWFEITATGEWSYTPGEYHGAEGHPRYGAPLFYPLTYTRGGCLIGKIGEDGDPFYIGAAYRGFADRAGTLYLQINDDILSDNAGYVEVQVDAAHWRNQQPPTPAMSGGLDGGFPTAAPDFKREY